MSFERYVLPAYQRRCELLHAAGKFLHAHWDGDCRPLLKYARDTGLDGIEAITPAPQGDVTLEETKAALGDMAHIQGTREMVAEAKTYLTAELQHLGLAVIAGQGNFVIARLPFNDQLAYRKLIRKGYMVRTMTSFRFPNHIRITLREKPVMRGFVQALAATLEEMRLRTAQWHCV